MERHAHVTAGQQREAADLLDLAISGSRQSVTQSVTEPECGVALNGPQGPGMGRCESVNGSGGRTRTYDQAVNSRPLYH